MNCIFKSIRTKFFSQIYFRLSNTKISTTETKTPQKDIIFVRHAESELNLASHNYRVRNNLPYIWELLKEDQNFLFDVKYNPSLLDCHITKNGVEQCLNARKICDAVIPNVILVSPLERTLETCNNLFGGRNIPIIVEPILGEALRSSCDFSWDLTGKSQRFPEFNFNKAFKEGDLWFLKHQSSEDQERYNRILNSLPKNSLHEAKVHAMLDFMAKSRIFELPLNVRNRVSKIKRLLLEYKKQYHTIAVIAHYNTINFTVSRSFNEENEPVDSANVINCEVYMDSLEEMLKYK